MHTLPKRAEVLSAFKAVSRFFYILGEPTICQGDDYVHLLRQIHPAALAFSAGDAYAEAKRAGAATLGAECWEFSFEAGRSTSAVLGSIRSPLGIDGLESVAGDGVPRGPRGGRSP